MTDEYIEHRERYYMPKRKKEGGKLQRFVVAPMIRMLHFGKPSKDAKKERAEA